MISWKSNLTSLSDHLTRRAAQTYKWYSENPCSSAYGKKKIQILVMHSFIDQILSRRSEVTYKVGVPHADYVLDTDLAHEETVHPSETELDKFDTFLLKVF